MLLFQTWIMECVLHKGFIPIVQFVTVHSKKSSPSCVLICVKVSQPHFLAPYPKQKLQRIELYCSCTWYWSHVCMFKESGTIY